MVLLYDEMPVRRPRHIRPGRLGYCPMCIANVTGNLVDEGIGRDDAYGRSIVHEDWVNRCPEDGMELLAPIQLDNVCGIHGDALQPARVEETETE